MIAGNPPWLAYRYIKDKTYQAEVKKLTFGYGLLGSGDVKLFTTMDLSTLFMVHCEARYLRPGGMIAFVMPRSVVTGARQHRAFRGRGLTRVLDLQAVTPLFNTETCVLIRRADDLHADQIPTTRYAAALPAHQMALADAATFSDDRADDHPADRRCGSGGPLLLRAVPARRNAHAAQLVLRAAAPSRRLQPGGGDRSRCRR